MIREPSVITFKYGFTYSHFRGDWLFCFAGHLNNFKFGLDWGFNRWQLDILYLYIGPFELSWERIFAKKKRK